MAQVNVAEQGLVAGLLNTAAQLGTALGLALLDTIAASSTAILKGSGYTDATALVAGFRWAFFVSAGVAVVGVFVAAPGDVDPALEHASPSGVRLYAP